MLLLASAILMVAWSFIVPVFEAPDEPAHWRYARYLRDNRELPRYNAVDQEANSPPLYYAVVAPFARHSEVPPHLIWPDIDGIHMPSAPRYMQNRFSDFGSYWPIRTTRLVTILISLVTVLFCYKAGVEATGRDQTGVLAGALAAFLPEFTFRGMNVSNDAMVAALGSVTVYLILRLVKRGPSFAVAIATAVAMAAAFLSKTSAMLFPVSFALAILTERTSWTRRLKLLSAVGITVLLAAPWLLRNQLLYGDVLARNVMLTAVAHLIRQKPITSPYFLHVFPRFTGMSFVGLFGWMSIVMPGWIYKTFEVLAVLGLAGYALGLARRKISWRLTAILLSIVLLNLLVVIEINRMFDQPQGRYMFPALAAIAVLTALGLENLFFWHHPSSLSTHHSSPPDLDAPASLLQHPDSSLITHHSSPPGLDAPASLLQHPDSSLITHHSSLQSAIFQPALVAALFILNLYVLIMVVLPAYWPPPRMATAPLTTPLAPTSFDGLDHAGKDDELIVTGDNPQLLFAGDISASQYNFLTFKIRGTPAHGTATGALYLRACACDPASGTRIPFKWMCDGNERKVIIPLYLLPEWQGHFAGLRLNLLDPPDAGFRGSSVQLTDIELVTSISDTSGP